MPLYLVGGGLGPGYQTEILIKLLNIGDKIYVETYTVPSSDWLLAFVTKHASGEVIVADRSTLEERALALVSEAKDKNIVVVVPGDPMIATTHRSLIMMAEELGVKHRVIPGVSGVCASKSLSLLDFYKFGRTVTVPGPWRRVKPYSVLGYIYDNACIGLHTLALLDIKPSGEQLLPPDAVATLLQLEEEIGVDTLSKAAGFVIERAGYEDGRVRLYNRLSDIVSYEDKWRQPSSIIIPGEITPIDEEIISKVYKISEVNGIDRDKACSSSRTLKEYLGL
ncbi:MAG: diphthine synthase [Crenarchaeota archaeon]|nr:diphthine synthase [Thermoproteota archaeon]